MKEFYKVGLRTENFYNLSVLTQSWKKVNFFMRNDNWYTDFLELDDYCFNLENKLMTLRDNPKGILNDNEVDLIPVPKNNLWEISKDWKVVRDKTKSEEIELRNIAKTSINSQILSMSALMNLAELVENIQRRINEDPIEASSSKVYSYGNRLDCHWEFDGEKYRAYFKTGSKNIYEKYQKNYKLFINRPSEICKDYNEGLDLSKKMVIVSLDLKNFYDSIDLSTLYKKIDALVTKYADRNFSKEVSSILRWTNNQQEFKGLPQGLAASGFFANLFLIDFDNEIGKKIVTLKKIDTKNLELDSDFIVRDYCRYVDDLRIVLEVSKNQEIEQIKEYVHKMINKVITLHYPNTDLKLRESKTEVTEYLSNNTYPISDDLINRRQNLSGTPSVEDIKENINAFKHLLLMGQTSTTSQQKSKFSALQELTEVNFDLKATTIQRFAATELKRNINVSNTYNKKLIENQDLKEVKEQEAIAKLLIRNWLYNPSLMHLLKTALEIHCSTLLMQPILDMLLEKMKKLYGPNNSKKQKASDYQEYEYATSVYVSSQILTYTVTKLNHLRFGNNQHSFIDFKEYLVSFAFKILEFYKNREIPWYLMQAVTFLLVSENRHFEILNANHKNLSLYKIYKDVSNNIIPENEKDTKKTVQYLSMAIVNQQISKEKEKFASWYIKLVSQNENEEKKLNYLVFNYDKNLFEEVRKSDTYYNKLKSKTDYDKYFEVEKGNSFAYKNNQQISLAKIILSLENPFKYENALLLLLSNLLKDENAEYLKKPVFLNDINVICKNWDDIQNPNKYTEEFFKLKFVNIQEKSETDAKNYYDKKLLLADFPYWLHDEGHFKTWFEKELLAFYEDKNLSDFPHLDEFVDVISTKVSKYSVYLDERKILYSIGKIMKSAIIGDYDYTNIYIKEKINRGYTGIKNTIYSRSFGLNISFNALSDGESPISPWLVDVLFNNLRWPYAYRTLKNDKLFTYSGLKKKVKEVIHNQKSIYGKMSDLPINIYPTSNPRLSNKDTLRVASVQTMMPYVTDFDAKNPLYFSTIYRNKHREHLINLTHLIEKHFSAQQVDEANDLKVDLIIFPELSIHTDDIDLLMKLSKKTGASIFAGLTFTEHPTDASKIINRAIWILNDVSEDGTAVIKKIYQGKYNVTNGEEEWGINKYRPFQVVIDLKLKSGSCKISGSICYDATDINLAADLKNITDTYIVAAMNKDVPTFDNMASALSYHMYQPVILVNTGEYGGSTVQAPYSGYDKLIAHLHGNKQLGISIFDIAPMDFKNVKEAKLPKKRKTPPANYPGRS